MPRKINIGGDIDDPTYRYTRDSIEIKYENKNGIQTKITNLEIISNQLHVRLEELQFCIKKNVPSSYHHDTISGRIEQKDLETILERFIKKYVLCSNCSLPELNDRSCKACGHTDKKKEKGPDKELELLEKSFGGKMKSGEGNNAYRKIKEKVNSKLLRKYPSDLEKREEERERYDYDYTKDEWVPSDYGHSKLDVCICEALHILYNRRDNLLTKIKNKEDFEIRVIEHSINKLWDCSTEREFKNLVKLYDIKQIEVPDESLRFLI